MTSLPVRSAPAHVALLVPICLAACAGESADDVRALLDDGELTSVLQGAQIMPPPPRDAGAGGIPDAAPGRDAGVACPPTGPMGPPIPRDGGPIASAQPP